MTRGDPWGGFEGLEVKGVRLGRCHFDAYVELDAEEVSRRAKVGNAVVTRYGYLSALAGLMHDVPYELSALPALTRHRIKGLPGGVVEFLDDTVMRRWRPALVVKGAVAHVRRVTKGVGYLAGVSPTVERCVILHGRIPRFDIALGWAKDLGVGVVQLAEGEETAEVILPPRPPVAKLGSIESRWRLAEAVYRRVLQAGSIDLVSSFPTLGRA